MRTIFDDKPEDDGRQPGRSKASLRKMLADAVKNTGGVAVRESEKEDRRLQPRPPSKAPATIAKIHAPKNDLPPAENVRSVASINVAQKFDVIFSTPPQMRMVRPIDLKIESAYQRDLSGKSLKLIRKIVIKWNWAKFKPPVCAETESGLFIVDGQHTAIAAASRPEIVEIPVMVVAAARIEQRAEAFVSHNRDRLTMTAAQVFYGDIAAGNFEARAVLDAITRAGGTIPKLPLQKNYAKPGQIAAVGVLRDIQRTQGPVLVERIIRIATLSRVAPIAKTVIAALRMLLTEKHFADIETLPDLKIAAALGSLKNIEAVSQHYAAETGQSRYRACALLIQKAAAS